MEQIVVNVFISREDIAASSFRLISKHRMKGFRSRIRERLFIIASARADSGTIHSSQSS